jgi:hypothetical protein
MFFITSKRVIGTSMTSQKGISFSTSFFITPQMGVGLSGYIHPSIDLTVDHQRNYNSRNFPWRKDASFTVEAVWSG